LVTPSACFYHSREQSLSAHRKNIGIIDDAFDCHRRARVGCAGHRPHDPTPCPADHAHAEPHADHAKDGDPSGRGSVDRRLCRPGCVWSGLRRPQPEAVVREPQQTAVEPAKQSVCTGALDAPILFLVVRLGLTWTGADDHERVHRCTALQTATPPQSRPLPYMGQGNQATRLLCIL